MDKILIIVATVVVIGVMIAVGLFFYQYGKKQQESLMQGEVRSLTIKLNKFTNYFRIFDKWMMLKEDGITFEEYFRKNNYKKVAIYGMGVMGGHLYEELKGCNVDIVYGIDKKMEIHYSNIPIKKEPESSMPVDVIIVTATFQYKEIKAELEKKVDCDIVSLEDVVLACQ